MTMLKEASSFASDVTFAKPFQQQKSHLGKQQSTSFSDTTESISSPKDVQVKKEEQPDKLKKAKTMFKNAFLKYWFLLGLVIAIILAWRFPDVGRKDGYIRAEWSIKWGNHIIIVLILFVT